MTATTIRVEPGRPALPGASRLGATVLAVVGFDGSRPSCAALEAATELIRGRDGHLEIIYVAHMPAYVGLSAPALVGMREGFDDISAELNDAVRVALDDREARWHFQRRNGAIIGELVAAATELRRNRVEQNATVVIIVGGSAHLAHHIAGSVAVALARDAGFPLLVVPAAATPVGAANTSIDSSSYLG